ncbi:quinoprotein dehydrogenase-associated putative ABC transporter substrate-binding protein [Parasalinivibrio latis]|uniref:quinoprotein dehydrogenase-associated putative ABC transporter substrate-binding protein n=1 Tax=Parasalinivibrio latis TaxID=2952610 RepID=UPI0030DE3B05
MKSTHLLSLGTAVLLGLVLTAASTVALSARAANFPFPGTPPTEVLRVCADPNNLPFSNKAQEGFENKIAQMVADFFEVKLEFVWLPQRMGFVRNTLKKWLPEENRFACDIIMGVPAEFDQAVASRPYYKSAYSLVASQNSVLKGISTIDDVAAMPDRDKVTLKLAGFSPSPTVTWLQMHNLFFETQFFRTMSGDPEVYPGRIVERVAEGEFDGVMIWGPIAGYFSRTNPALKVLPLKNGPHGRVTFSISMAVRYGEQSFGYAVEHALKVNYDKVRDILNEYGVPQLDSQEIYERLR